MSEPELSFFCPAYLDAGNLPLLIPEVHALLSRHTDRFEILIVEDGSPDATAAVADALAERFAEVRVIHHTRNLGYGRAIRSGLTAARGRVVLYTDGDRQFDVREFEPFFPLLDQGWDVVTGVRRRRAEGARRRVQGAVFRLAARVLTGSTFRDPSCAFKMVRREVVTGWTPASESALIGLELLLAARRSGWKILERDVTHLPRLHGAASGARPGVVLATIRELWRYRTVARGRSISAAPPR